MNFQKELEEYKNLNYVSNLQIENQVNGVTQVKIVTLEGQELNLECDSNKGIKVLNQNKVFTNMEELLKQYSQLYCKKHDQDLSKQLNNLIDQVVQDNEDEEEWN